MWSADLETAVSEDLRDLMSEGEEVDGMKVREWS